MAKSRSILELLLSGLLVISCTETKQETELPTIQELNKNLTDVIVENVFTPPVSSRIYAYSNLAAYECLRLNESTDFPSFSEAMEGLEVIKSNQEIIPELAAAVSFYIVGDALATVKDRMNPIEAHRLLERKDELIKTKESEITKSRLTASVEFGSEMATQILALANKDGYNARKYPIYVPDEEMGTWKPTAPAFMPAIEPNWNSIKPFLLENIEGFSVDMENTSFSDDETSEFYSEAMEVYKVVKEADSTMIEIAKFWDCNPNIISGYVGNLKLFYQKISPGGHWIHIASDATSAKGLSAIESSEIITSVALGIANGFISCWDVKYSTNLIRPETFIQKNIDDEWLPILETPAFPEHTSGHSVVSGAASTILTFKLGEDFYFVDSTEVKYGLPPRTFLSFNQAAEEAAVSRLYGGIHYRPAIELGLTQGKNVGSATLSELRKLGLNRTYSEN